MGTAHTSVPEVLDALKEVTYPADRDRLVTAAEQAGASDDVVMALRGLPAEEYAGRAEVARSVRVAPEPEHGHGAAQRRQRAGRGGRPGVAQHLWEEPKTPIQEEFDR
ncbi:DUF2795 domain-containing protein [Streptomyces sp. 5-8]|uniref:DUF2795 domain-containing protein n=1 Tax=Streptomyces musisoli TaxID=2802280 RepID=A0ABS1P289_9ACTN|nr:MULTISPECIES: DUF2795 domain-containing protein [Streptomyces]MBL1106472.1 DUF2795 domain-containing protein [Streptomyces musisoli]MBY8840729.1 DUF2795 domain-containing protein [Streptomyces sp. SP2-10]